MPVTRNAQIAQWEIDDQWTVRYSIYNCRHVGGNPARIWSQHAASEPQYDYQSNALDIFASTAVLDEIAAFLQADRVRLSIRQILWRVRAHFDHIHVDFWPKMQDDPSYVPPCKGGTLVVVNEDGSHGHTFGLPPEKGDDMGLNFKKIVHEHWGEEGLGQMVDAGTFGDNVDRQAFIDYWLDPNIPVNGPPDSLQHLVEVVVAWSGVNAGGSVDLSNYYTKGQVYNKDQTYNKGQSDGRFVNIGEGVKIVK